jgi:hypothetical protein
MSNSQRDTHVRAFKDSATFLVAVGFAVVLCIGCCTLILLIPTGSINVDTVYQGF